jgi:hypothetical protein
MLAWLNSGPGIDATRSAVNCCRLDIPASWAAFFRVKLVSPATLVISGGLPVCLGAIPETYPQLVDCFTPNRGLIRLMAKSLEHEEFLLRMNPKPPTVAKVPLRGLFTCGNCQNFKPHHAHGTGSGSCAVGVKSPGICHWSETQHQCNGYSALNKLN